MIGAGKSTVSGMFRDLGYPVFDADECTHVCLRASHPCCAEVAAHFGEAVLDEEGNVNRAELGARIFGNEEERQALNRIVHPYVLREMLKWMEEQPGDFVFAEVALLFEAGWDQYFDESIVVTCSQQTAVQRMMVYRGYTEENARSRIGSQLDMDIQLAKADTVIYNEGTIADLQEAVIGWLKDRGELWN